MVSVSVNLLISELLLYQWKDWTKLDRSLEVWQTLCSKCISSDKQT